MPPDHLVLRALSTSILQASWNSSEGAAWLHLGLTDLLGGVNLTVVVRRGVSNHTFLHLSPGTRYELTLCAAAGPHKAMGPSATEWTRKWAGRGHSRDFSALPLWQGAQIQLVGVWASS